MARKVLLGETRGYRSHPQLHRFRTAENPHKAIDHYLHHVVDEADRRGYNFNRSKLEPRPVIKKLPVTTGQLAFEREHLKRKLDVRDPTSSKKLPHESATLVHPTFELIDGLIATWERV